MLRLIAALSSLSLVVATPAFADDVPDPVVTARTKLSLFTTAGVSSTAVRVDTIDGRVTLSGKVASTAERELAGKVAGEIDGVRSVTNLLQVVPASAAVKVAVADAKVRKAVSRVLAEDRDFRAVELLSVNDGVVGVSGTVPQLTDHVKLVSKVWLVPGVKRVSSEVKTTTPAAEAASTAAADGTITTTVKVRLLVASEVPSLDVNVDTNDGTVTLFGIVPTKTARAAAEREARQVPGVKKIENDLQVVASDERRAVERKDDEILASINSAFATRPALQRVHIDVSKGVVRLSGDVPSLWDELTALRIARFTEGVRGLDDAMVVRSARVN